MKILDIISEESKDEYKPHMMYKGSKKDYRAKYPTKKKHHDSLMSRGYNHDDPETKKVEEYGSSQPLTSIKPKTKKVKERYGMSPGNAGSRSSVATQINATKRANNRNADANRELNIANKSLQRRQARLARVKTTGIPGRLLNPPPAAQQGQQK